MIGKILSREEIGTILPYSGPILLPDRIEIVSETTARGLKALSFNDMVYQGHFPNHPITPGVLQVEAMFQTASVLIKDKLDPDDAKDIHIKKISKVKFRKPALPGDRLIIDVEIKSFNGLEAEVTATNRIRDGLACQATFTISVRERVFDLPVASDFTEIDKPAQPEMDITRIMELIPHRYPFLFIDYIASVDGPRVVAIKNVTATEPFMRHYSSDYATLPSSIQVEIIAQAGCVHTLLRPENKGKLAYFMSISNMEYLAPVRPGDQLEIIVDTPPGGSKFGKGAGEIKVEGETVARGNIAFALVDE